MYFSFQEFNCRDANCKHYSPTKTTTIPPNAQLRPLGGWGGGNSHVKHNAANGKVEN